MKRFIAQKICLPFAITGLAVFSATAITSTPAIIAKTVIKSMSIHPPTEQLFDDVVDYSTVVAGVGLISFVVGFSGGVACGGFGDEYEDRERMVILKEDVFLQCLKCKYYSRSSVLPCAVHPQPEIDCPDFEKNY
ncbi:MAG: hypothetical protein H0X31_06830 [Nostocaceae cyanobacterium]|nr:hypothetical protein [Nostocaceae cyanobacterium]